MILALDPDSESDFQPRSDSGSGFDPIKSGIIAPLLKGRDVEAVQGVPQHNAGVEGQRHEAPLAQSPPFPFATHGSEPFVQGGPSALEPEMKSLRMLPNRFIKLSLKHNNR